MLATELTKPPLLPVIAGYFQMKPQIEQIDIKVKILHPRAQLPEYQTEQAAGMDVHAAINQPIFLGPGSRCVINTGLAVEIPPGYEIQIRSRSGLSIKEGIVVVNSPATIDSDYRGEIKVALANLNTARNPDAIHPDEYFQIIPGMRIGQFVVAKVPQGRWTVVDELSPTQRGSGGFGSTGTK